MAVVNLTEMKTCTKCQRTLALSSFAAKTDRPGKHDPACRDCRNYRLRQNYKKPEVKQLVRGRTLKYKFGVTTAEYNQMFEAQQGSCATCKRHQSELSKTMAVDHDHKTGKVRGLLCDHCNRLLGNYEKKPELFIAFDEYLSNGEGGN